ncbi:MAG: transcription factor [Candidatus Woesearchaeota archaeon]|nr:transcription factor [Candidatus Woesearchaeota archaeon]MDN5327646.1 transcription factor [Candidatus Woesearchaeota archaeon]
MSNFCKKCGGLLIPKTVGNKKKLVCLKCGYEEPLDKNKNAKISESIKQQKEIEIIEKSNDENLPVTDVECPKCGNNKAYFWLLQTRSADEAETKFFKCTKCGHVWRDYQ